MEKPKWQIAAQYCILLSMASSIDDIAGILESVYDNPSVRPVERFALDRYADRREALIIQMNGKANDT